MMFAVILKSYKPQLKREEIIDLFSEDKKGSLSIHKICAQGLKEYTGRPGQYWNFLTALLSLKDLVMKYDGIETTHTFFCFHNNVIGFKSLKDSSIDEFIKCEEKDYQDVYFNQKIVFFVAMLGDEQISRPNLIALQRLMGLSSCLGMIGGVESRAYFISGIVGNEFIVVDPHFTQVLPS
jgi:hypothetical protein